MKPVVLSAAERWRLLLGEAAQQPFGAALPGDGGAGVAMDRALGWLYGRDDGAGDETDTRDRHGGDGPSQLTVPDWINEIHELFPKETIERLERDAI
jgi:hypothetical protein